MRRFRASTGARLLAVMALASCWPHVSTRADVIPNDAASAAAAAVPTTSPGSATASNAAATTAAPWSAIVQQPRPFGYVLGDTLAQRILLQSGGHNFDPVALPPAERAGLWFARRSSRIDLAEDGHRWLVVDYQLINAPQGLITVSLPSLTLKSKVGNNVLSVPEWPISISPLTPRAAFAKGGLQELRPDHAAPTLPTRALRRQLEIWSGAFALTAVIWIAWWLVRSLRANANQPFARALRAIRSTGDDSEAAWVALHRAFDTTAGRSLQPSTLPTLFKQAPHFEPERAAIEEFYAESSRRFFGAGSSPTNTTRSGTWSLRPLCASLRRIEKQHER